MKRLSEIIEASDSLVTLLQGNDTLLIEDVCYDSRKVSANALFVAISGFSTDGHSYIDALYSNGHRLFLIESDNSDMAEKYPEATILVTNDSRRALSRVSALFFGRVSQIVPVVGVTGTNGKTSITYMLEAICKGAGKNPGIIGTVNYRWGTHVVAAPNTTPESRDLHSLMAQMVADGVDVIIMEVSSHGLELGRVEDIDFSVALFTNLTQDHLDFHNTFEEYYRAKKRLFTLLDSSHAPIDHKCAVINSDDNYGARLAEECLGLDYNVRTVAVGDGFYHIDAESVVVKLSGIGYTLLIEEQQYRLDLQLTARFNIFNSILAFGAADALGIQRSVTVKSLVSLQGIPGRFDRIASPLGFYTVVDYAHTDDALRKLLEASRDIAPKRIVTVFGCGGDRDKRKRPLMGKVAVSLSDYAIITSDNPRTEDPDAIVADVVAGVEADSEKYEVVVDRKRAIKRAVDMMHADELLVIAGKGHEDYQIIGTEKIHFDDKEVADLYTKERVKRESSL